MRAAQHTLSSIAAVLLIVGLVCVRVCDVGCASVGCAPRVPAAIQPDPAEAGHCHRKEPEPAPTLPGGDPPMECQIHDLTSVAETTETGFVKVPHPTAPAAVIFLAAGAASARDCAASARGQDFRPPPPRAVFSALRI
jgi:hypothetical protein